MGQGDDERWWWVVLAVVVALLILQVAVLYDEMQEVLKTLQQ